MSSLDESHLEVDGCLNFRDAGGWALEGGGVMRTGRLFRSDDPVRVTPEGRRAVAELGLVAVVDLRQHAQFVRSPGFVDPAITIHRPLVDRVIDVDNPPPLTDPEHLADLYEEMFERSREQIGDVVSIIGDRIVSGPVLVHCAFGKDRTGIIVALVQAAIGVPAESIADDYARSHEPARRRREWLLAEPLHDDPPIHRSPAYMFSAPRRSMEILVTRALDRHGSLLDWTRSFPLRDGTVERLNEGLREPS